MAQLIQICASQNDLFGLDGDGVVYHYNFHTHNWVRLGHGQRDHGCSPVASGQSPIGHAVVGDGEGVPASRPAPATKSHDGGGDSTGSPRRPEGAGWPSPDTA